MDRHNPSAPRVFSDSRLPTGSGGVGGGHGSSESPSGPDGSPDNERVDYSSQEEEEEEEEEEEDEEEDDGEDDGSPSDFDRNNTTPSGGVPLQMHMVQQLGAQGGGGGGGASGQSPGQGSTGGGQGGMYATYTPGSTGGSTVSMGGGGGMSQQGWQQSAGGQGSGLSGAAVAGASSAPVGGNGQQTQQQQQQPFGELKKIRACEACRGLKVRCEPREDSPDGACRRCFRAGRRCVVTVPTRKRQKKTDSRVSELEKKIDALTASLAATRGAISGTGAIGGSGSAGASASPPSVTSSSGRHQVPMASIEDPHPHQSGGGGPFGGYHGSGKVTETSPWGSTSGAAIRTRPQQHEQAQPRQVSFSSDAMEVDRKPSVASSTSHKRKYSTTREVVDPLATEEGAAAARPGAGGMPAQNGQGDEPYLDMIDRGVLTLEHAEELFARYNESMAPHMPSVVFPPGTTVADVRRTKPVLFLAILCAAASETPNIQRVMVKEMMHIFAHKIIIVGEKYIELIQALHVAVIWYWPPENFEELKFYQLIHIAVCMAIDIGLGRHPPPTSKAHAPATWRDHHLRRHPPPDPLSLESRRTWMSCYMLTTNASMALHRPNLLQWTPFMAECMDALANSPDRLPTDRYYTHILWTHRLAMEVGIQFSMDDPSSNVTLSDLKTQYALKSFERDMERYKASIPKEMMLPGLQLSFNVVSLYMHEIALHEHNVQGGIGGNLSTPHINALSACLDAVSGIFETFLSMDEFGIRCLPVFNFVRVAYAVVVLVKIYFAASTPGSELGRVISKEDMKVEYYLDNLLDKFRATAAEDRSRPAAKFMVVLVMLRSWFKRQGRTPMPPPPKQYLPFGEGMAPFISGGPPPHMTGGGAAGASAGADRDGSTTEAETPATTDDLAATNTTTTSSVSGGIGGRTDSDLSSAPPPSSYRTPDSYPGSGSQQANTPLQLLSEIATNDRSPGVRPPHPQRPQHDLPSTQAYQPWLTSAPVQPAQPFMYDGSEPHPAMLPHHQPHAHHHAHAHHHQPHHEPPPAPPPPPPPNQGLEQIPWLTNAAAFVGGAPLPVAFGFDQLLSMTDVMGDLSASDAGFEAAMNMALGLMPEAPGQQASDGRVGGPGQVQGGPGPGHSPQGGAGPGQHGHGGQDGTWYTGAGAMDAQGGIYGF